MTKRVALLDDYQGAGVSQAHCESWTAKYRWGLPRYGARRERTGRSGYVRSRNGRFDSRKRTSFAASIASTAACLANFLRWQPVTTR